MLIVALSVLAISGLETQLPTVSAGQQLRARTSIEIACINTSSNKVLYEFSELMDLSEIESATKRFTKATPHEEMVSYFPKPSSGWNLPLGVTGSGNDTYSWTDAIYVKDDSFVWIGIHDSVEGWSYDPDRSLIWKNWNITFDKSYPKWKEIQGYRAFEIRSTGLNAPEGAKSFGGLFIGLTKSLPIPEIGFPLWKGLFVVLITLLHPRISTLDGES